MDAQLARQSVVAAFLAVAVAACAEAPRTAKTAQHEALPFIVDDYPRAIAEAKRTGRPLFVDAWAPWCHSCLSMRAFVLTDPSLAPLAPDFVWLALDTEKAENAAFVARFTNQAWPTLWVIDPAREEPVLQWSGTATADELRALLGATRSADAATIEFVRANRSVANDDLEGAERQYRAALAAKPDAQRPRIVEGLVTVLYRRKDHAGCAETAAREGDTLPSGTSRADVLALGLSCAIEGKQKETTAKLEAQALRAALDEDPRTLADDRSALFEEVIAAREEAGDAKGKKEIAAKWIEFLEREAARAATKEARAVFDAHRLSAYIAFGEPQRAIPILTESERDFPQDYNPPARLARAYFELKRFDDARTAIDRAAAKVYGPRSMRVLALAADIAKARGDRGAERVALEQALSRTEGMPLSEGQKKLRATLGKRLAEL